MIEVQSADPLKSFSKNFIAPYMETFCEDIVGERTNKLDTIPNVVFSSLWHFIYTSSVSGYLLFY